MSVQALSLAFATVLKSPTQKLVLLALANYADTDMVCWPSVKALEHDTSLSNKPIRRALAEMAALGIIARRQRRRQDGTRASDIYRLNMQAVPATAGDNKRSLGPEQAVSGTGHEPRSRRTTKEEEGWLRTDISEGTTSARRTAKLDLDDARG